MSWPHKYRRNMPTIKYPQKWCCKPNYNYIEESIFIEKLGTLYDSTTYIDKWSKLCESQEEFDQYPIEYVEIDCVDCGMITYMDKDSYRKNPFSAKCEYCNSDELTVTYLDFKRKNLQLTINNYLKKFKWFVNIHYHYTDSTSLSRLINDA